MKNCTNNSLIGNFEITYVVCAAMSEVDELDTLDAPALLNYAFATPAALRAAELGDDYLKRIGTTGAGGAKAAAKPAKGKAGIEFLLSFFLFIKSHSDMLS